MTKIARDWRGGGVWAFAAALLLAVSPTRGALAQCGVDPNATGTPIGGGIGYPDIKQFGQADFAVYTRDGLIAAIAAAAPGDMIYIPNYVSIDMAPPGLHWSDWTINIDVPDLTIASGRGAGSGALVWLQPGDLNPPDLPSGSLPPLFHVTAPGVRFTGLRLEGSDHEVGTASYSPPTTDGIIVDGEGSLEVDNCELSGFTHGAIYAAGTVVDVHHNHIHHNRRTGLGYGLVLDNGSDGIIESNIFDHNRHNVAGTGDPFLNYEALYNLVIGEGSGQAFDMHGEGESDASIKSGFGGGEIHIAFNTFVDNNNFGVLIRGLPYTWGYVDNNWFTHSVLTTAAEVGSPFNSSAAIYQRWEKHPWVPGASYQTPYPTADTPPPPPPGVTATDNFRRIRQLDNCFNQSAWFRYDPQYQGFYPLARNTDAVSNVAFVNFDGDSKADVFRVVNGTWQVSYDGVSPYTTIATQQPYALSELRFGDFVGDGRTDVFRASGSGWFVWNIATGTWQQIASSGYGVSQLAFGNFVGDSRTDVFRASGSGWYVSNSGAQSWQLINGSHTTLASLAFGDFLGDGRTDVFTANGTEWLASDAGATNWQHLAYTSATIPDLLFGNFVGDSHTDALIAAVDSGSTVWSTSQSAAGSWVPYVTLSHGAYPVSSLRAADFTGDGVSDIFFSGQP